MLYRLRPLLLLLRGQTEETHLKGPVDDHDNGNRRRKTEDKSGRIIDDLRDIAETDVPFPDLIGAHPSKYSRIGIRREDVFRKEGCQSGREYIKGVFHMDVTRDYISYLPDCIHFFEQSKFFHSR